MKKNWSTPRRNTVANSRRAAAGVALGISATFALTGCAMGAAPSGAAEPASTTVPEGDVALKLWTVQSGGTGQALQNVIDAYEAEHPNVTITLDYADNESFSKSFKLVMSSDSAPDITECGQGYTQQAPLVEAGLILPLEDYSALYDWPSRIPQGFLDEASLTEDATSFGSGTLYGLPIAGNMLGIYYNAAKLQQLGISVPFASMADFETALATAKAAGEVPLMMGNQDGDPGQKVWEGLRSAYEDPAEKKAWIYGEDGADIDNDAVTASTDELADWVGKGYIYEGASGTSRDDGVARFTGGEGVFMVSGNWYLDAVNAAMGADAGFTAFPAESVDAAPRASGATSQPWCISSLSENPDTAANFLDFAASEGQSQTLLDGGFLPIVAADSVTSASAATTEALAEWNAIVEADGLTLWSDWATPSMARVLNPALQELYAGRLGTSELLASLQDDWQSYMESK